MDITRIIVLMYVLMLGTSSCKKEYQYDRDKYRMVLRYNPWVTLDFSSRVVRIDFGSDVKVDTFRLSVEEINRIKQSFEDNHIADYKGDLGFGEPYKNPHAYIKMELFKKGKLQVQMIILDEYNYYDYYHPGEWNIDRRIIRFRDELKKIIKDKDQFKEIMKQSSDMQRIHGEYLM